MYWCTKELNRVYQIKWWNYDAALLVRLYLLIKVHCSNINANSQNFFLLIFSICLLNFFFRLYFDSFLFWKVNSCLIIMIIFSKNIVTLGHPLSPTFYLFYMYSFCHLRSFLITTFFFKEQLGAWQLLSDTFLFSFHSFYHCTSFYQLFLPLCK